jgi:uncharacterized protein YgiM (DUF1202 family)
MKRLSFLFAFLLLRVTLVAAQTAVVTHSANLRPDPSTNGAPVTKLNAGAQVNLLGTHQISGYFHVRTEEGTEGWAWSRSLHIQTNEAETSAEHVGPASLYPNSKLTPGQYATLSLDDLTKTYTDNCPRGRETCTYSQSHRKVRKSVHDKVYDEYDVPEDQRNGDDGEVDHFYPLCAGGSNDISNLWYQPAVGDWNGKDFGYHTKDKLEAYICVQIKAGKLDPKEAYDRITKDWVKFYLDEGLDKDN